MPAREWIFGTVLIVLSAVLWLIPAPGRFVNPSGESVPATVDEVDNSTLMQHGLVRFGSQLLTVTVKSGRFAGKSFPAVNELRAQLELDKVFSPGDRITVVVNDDVRPGETVLTAKDYDRSFWTAALFILFCLLLVIFGGWTGVKALLSFVFSCVVIWRAVIPLALRGWPASWVAFGAVVLLTAVNM